LRQCISVMLWYVCCRDLTLTHSDSMSSASEAGALWERSRRVRTAKRKSTLNACFRLRILSTVYHLSTINLQNYIYLKLTYCIRCHKSCRVFCSSKCSSKKHIQLR